MNGLPCFDCACLAVPTAPSGRRAAEIRFSHRVDILVPIGGRGNRLTEMLMWCRANVPAGAWDQHGHFERPIKRAVSAVLARFYFANAADAEAFRKLWASD